MSDKDTTWLPNLVGGVSIWKLAPDLNEEKFFGGRLLVPETEGSESLPSTVRWNLAGLVPLSEARAKHPAECEAAVGELKACLDRAAKAFAKEDSGYYRYREALTVPSLEAEGVENYFFSPTDRRLYVINWGATPRTLAGQKEFLFGYADFGKVFGASAAAATAATATRSAGDQAGEKAADEPKKTGEPKKADDSAKRPIWVYVLAAVGFLLLLLALLALLKTCNDEKNADAGADANALEASSDANALEAGSDANALEAGSDAMADAARDAGDAAADAGDGGGDAAADAGDAGKDGGKDAGPDGGKKPKGKTGFADDASFKGGKVTVKGGGAGGGGAGGGTVKITVSPGPSGGSQAGPYRRHDHPQAVAWRIVQGEDRVSRTEEAGKRFDVYLHKGESFDGVEVEYQSDDGEWHPH